MSNIRESSVVGAATPANHEKTENIHDYMGSIHENIFMITWGPIHGNHSIAHVGRGVSGEMWAVALLQSKSLGAGGGHLVQNVCSRFVCDLNTILKKP